MNCKTAHQHIHLFEELTKDEQTQVLNHIEECEPCRELNESMKWMNGIVNRVAKVKIEPTNPIQVANRIMSTIHEQERESINVLDWVLSSIRLQEVKWAMAGISALMIFTFAVELNQPIQNLNQASSKITSDSKASVLNAKKFHDQLNKYKSGERHTSMLGCKDPFKMSHYNVECLREKLVHFKAL